ncbi:Os11g0582900 [Oryza sativa Japonica Group]|uniref:Os11g0582900 protein n=1 Tax=Oryza sativa subsp. japonica TaxID=39947 RepID=Q2R219_ORYSJ|nr:hypothetical protein LOC_Os11g37310 [Oryza sativa Japonica Group]BAT14616.1 Os11g0582900 [Oryza sativa Japonica Group]
MGCSGGLRRALAALVRARALPPPSAHGSSPVGELTTAVGGAISWLVAQRTRSCLADKGNTGGGGRRRSVAEFPAAEAVSSPAELPATQSPGATVLGAAEAVSFPAKLLGPGGGGVSPRGWLALARTRAPAIAGGFLARGAPGGRGGVVFPDGSWLSRAPGVARVARGKGWRAWTRGRRRRNQPSRERNPRAFLASCRVEAETAEAPRRVPVLAAEFLASSWWRKKMEARVFGGKKRAELRELLARWWWREKMILTASSWRRRGGVIWGILGEKVEEEDDYDGDFLVV